MTTFIRAQLHKPKVRTVTANKNILLRSDGIYLTFGESPESKYGHPPPANTVKFTFKPIAANVEAYNTGLHFHVDKTEFLMVEKGSIGVQLGTDSFTLTAQTGEVAIPPWMPHAWWLLPSTTPDTAEDTVIWERTGPASREKEIFFRNLISMIEDLGHHPPSLIQFFTTFSKLDNYPLLGSWQGIGARTVAYLWTKAIGRLGTFLGFYPFYAAYTPMEIYEQYKSLL